MNSDGNAGVIPQRPLIGRISRVRLDGSISITCPNQRTGSNTRTERPGKFSIFGGRSFRGEKGFIVVWDIRFGETGFGTWDLFKGRQCISSCLDWLDLCTFLTILAEMFQSLNRMASPSPTIRIPNWIPTLKGCSSVSCSNESNSI